MSAFLAQIDIFAADSVPELMDQMQLFAEEVRPKVS